MFANAISKPKFPHIYSFANPNKNRLLQTSKQEIHLGDSYMLKERMNVTKK